ncbi:stt-3 [Symbiodinium natans]|uniref:dolichyl-diphosphooligosaccharide--protein glycotransferase n=1 Tax=Symbiodinium natans TaxID=878477 RepID=A0A812SD49_9DINO|nr:stt-3 [Symbiodinium natans]
MATGIMAIIPAHIMRSVGGKFDNEAVAMTAICMTFWLWLLSIRSPKWWPIGVFTGLSYINMVAAWGGYIFVLNMIGVHAVMLVLLGRFTSGVHKAYSLFYVIGTAGAVQIPVVGWQPLRSLEQMGPLLVFIGYQVLAFCDFQRRRKKMETWAFVKYRILMCILTGLALVAVAVMLYPTGYFGPLSSRIRGLFVKHTKTGNPLVDSVAEHQPANPKIYASHLGLPLNYVLFGGLVSAFNRNNGFYFLCLYGFIASHFSGKMSRLVLICGPIVSVACGIWCGFLLDMIIEPFLLLLGKKGYEPRSKASSSEDTPKSGKGKAEKEKGDKAGKDKDVKKKRTVKEQDPELEEHEEELRPGGAMQLKRMVKGYYQKMFPESSVADFRTARYAFDNKLPVLLVRAVASVVFVGYMLTMSELRTELPEFVERCKAIGEQVASPTVMYAVRQKDGSNYIVDDYYKGYKWLEKNTAEDARVMAWWDYGYQITGIANRTSIADGNTWNHEHIATLGRTLTSEVKRAHNAIRHLADYVLVWGGGQRDDLGKSPHLARIGNSVFPDHCGDDDPKCTKFGFYADRSPTPMMEKSLLYKLVEHNVKKGVRVNERFFKHVHTTKHGLMRIYEVQNVSQESKDWIADPKNRVCDAPGSWYCVGQYPPALEKLIAKRRNFAQIEDFNRKGEKSAYTRLIEKEKGEL